MMRARLGWRCRTRLGLASPVASVLMPILVTVLAGVAVPSAAGTASSLARGPEAESALGATSPNLDPAPANAALRSRVPVISPTEEPSSSLSISTSSPRRASTAAPAPGPSSLPTQKTIGPGAVSTTTIVPGTPATTARTAGDVAGGLGKVALVLMLIVGLIALTAWLLRRLGVARVGAGNLIRVVSSIALGSRERIMVLEVADQWIVIGVTSTAINTLTTMPRQKLTPGTDSFAIPPVGKSFAFWLNRTMDKRSQSNSKNSANLDPGRHSGLGKSAYGGANNDSGTIDGI